MEYHLAGTADAHMAASPSKLVVDFARRWAQERGNRSLHLAGTPRSGHSLSHFKAGFSPLLLQVYSWRLVPDPTSYGVLVDRWHAGARVAADPPDAFFPAYRGLGPRPSVIRPGRQRPATSPFRDPSHGLRPLSRVEPSHRGQRRSGPR